MDGRERILTALSVREPDRVPLYIHGINEAPIIGIGRHLKEGLPEPEALPGDGRAGEARASSTCSS